jgi:putative transposase
VSVRQRLYIEPGQVAGLVEHCHQARFVFNIGLEQRSLWKWSKHDRGSHPEYGSLDAARVNTATQMRELAQLRGELEWLRAGSSSVQQAALRDLDRAFANFWAGRARYPQFKRRTEREGSFVIRDLTVARLNRKWGLVTVPKIGQVRFRISRGWADINTATSARVTHRNGRWHICFTTPAEAKTAAGTGAVVGIDRGVANTIATSDGEFEQIPGWTDGEQTRFLALEQRLARQTRAAKKSGRPLRECRNRNNTLDLLAALRRKLDQRRTDWIEKTTTELARVYDAVVVEDLRVPNMVRRPKPKPDQDGRWLPNRARAKAKLNKAIHASRWGQFTTRLDHKTTVVRVLAAYSSQECRKCGHTSSENRESQAVFACTRCGHTQHADINAAQVILGRGKPMLAHAVAPNPGTPGARPHKTHTTGVGRGNPTGGRTAA